MSKLFSLLFFLYFCSNNNSHFIHVLFLPLYSVLKSLFFRHRLHYFSVKSLTVLYCTLNLRGLHGFSHCLQLPLGLLNQPCAAVRRAAEGRRGRPPRKAAAEGRRGRPPRRTVASVSSGSTLLASRRTPRRGRPPRHPRKAVAPQHPRKAAAAVAPRLRSILAQPCLQASRTASPTTARFAGGTWRTARRFALAVLGNFRPKCI